jgi:aspartate/methionine/tyrosine aminotransferase
MHWSKTQSAARFNLALSGVAHLPWPELPVRLEDLDCNGPSAYGYAPLQQALARKCGVAPECVCAATGVSLANHLALAAALEPGDEVLIEQPAYELLVSTASFLGLKIKRFQRRFEDGFQLDLGRLEQEVSARTRMIVLTNLHNPSSVLLDDTTLRGVGAIARRAGAMVLVDEVYLDAAFERAPSSAFLLGDEFITTNSLTKVYGLSGLRCGWVLARPELVERMWRLQDLFGVIPAHPAERLSVLALAHLDRIRARYQALLAANRRLLEAFLDSRSDLRAVPTESGTTVFPRVLAGRVEELCHLLRHKYETTVVPGRFFDMPDHIRIGICGETASVAGGLERLGAALDELQKGGPARG